MTVVPAIGFYGLAKWTATALENLIKDNKIKEKDVQLGLQDFTVFNEKLFLYLPLSKNNPKAYSLKTRRMMFGWAVKTISSLPESQALTRTMNVTVGTTVTGSAGYTLWSASSRVEKTVSSNYNNAQVWMNEALNSPNVTPEFRDLVREAKDMARRGSTDWAANRGSSPVFTGIGNALNKKEVRESVSDADKLARAASKLKMIAEKETLPHEQKIAEAKNILASLKSSEANSVFEATILTWPIWLKNKIKFLVDFIF